MANKIIGIITIKKINRNQNNKILIALTILIIRIIINNGNNK